MNLLSCAKPYVLCDTTAPSLYPNHGTFGALLWKLVAKAAESHRLEHESGLRLLSADRISRDVLNRDSLWSVSASAKHAGQPC